MQVDPFHQAHQVFVAISHVLGEAFSLNDLVELTELQRGKPLQIEQDTMPIAMTGYCLALQDVDLICTRAGLDDVLLQATRLHEIAHLLLGHVPLLSNGSATPAYAVFRSRRDLHHALHRSSSLLCTSQQEKAAEVLATFFGHGLSQEAASPPRLARDLHG